LYNYASKILSSFSDPVSVTLLLAIAALVGWRNRSRSFALLFLLTILLGSLSWPPVAVLLIGTLEDQYRDEGIAAVAPAQAIVVLGGSLKMPSGEHSASGLGETSDRLLVAFRLYRAGKAPLVVCSGGNNPLLGGFTARPEGEGMCGLLEEWGVPKDALVVEGASINTRENAVESRSLLAERGIVRIVLVTSAVHMPRAAAAFEKVGFEVEPAPADFRAGWGKLPSIFRWMPSPTSLVDSSAVLHEWIGLWAYRLRGWA